MCYVQIYICVSMHVYMTFKGLHALYMLIFKINIFLIVRLAIIYLSVNLSIYLSIYSPVVDRKH